MLFYNPLTGPPARIEIGPHPRKSALASLSSKSQNRQFPCFPLPLLVKENSFFDVPSRNVYENKQSTDKLTGKIESFQVEIDRDSLTLSATWEQLGSVVGVLAPSLAKTELLRPKQSESPSLSAKPRPKPEKNGSRGHDVYENNQFMRNPRFFEKSYVFENKQFIHSIEAGVHKKKG
jgi:hypothetical protein